MSVSQTGTLALSATTQAGTDYIYTTAYYAKGSTWLPVTLQGNNAAPSYSSGPATGSLPASILSTLPFGTNYVVLWDWLWDATAQCYKGPGLNQCNTGTWRLQVFSLTQSASGPVVSLSPATLTFPSEPVGSTSPVEYETLTNIGNATLNRVGSYAITGDFAFPGLGTCASTTAPGTNCTISVQFTPTAIGTRTGQVSITDDAPGSPHTFNLSGTGLAGSIIPTPTPTPTAGCTSNCFYISPAGSDANAGTSAGAPWKTFAHAVPLLNPGNTLLLLNGTYQPGTGTGYPNITCGSNAQNGTSSAPITLRALNERQALIQGDGSTEPFQIHNCSYWNIIGLHLKDGDFTSHNESDGPWAIYNSSHLLVRRNLLEHPNRCQNNNLMFFSGTTNSVVEENELYFFHRWGITLWSGSNNNEVRRNYVNARGAFAATNSTCATYGTGAPGMGPYESSSNIFENNIGEGNSGDGNAGENFAAEDNASNNKYLGNMGLKSSCCSFNINAHSSASADSDNSYINDVSIIPTTAHFWLRGGTNTVLNHVSMFGGMAIMGIGVNPSGITGVPYSDTVSNSQGVNLTGASTGAYFIDSASQAAGGTATYTTDNNFNNSVTYNPNTRITNPLALNPGYGTCYLWAPDASPLKGKATDGGDVGATVLYEYQGGTLTSNRLWDPTTGAPFFKGATVAGLNDVAGSSLFDVGKRLNVNQNGCAFPVGY